MYFFIVNEIVFFLIAIIDFIIFVRYIVKEKKSISDVIKPYLERFDCYNSHKEKEMLLNKLKTTAINDDEEEVKMSTVQEEIDHYNSIK